MSNVVSRARIEVPDVPTQDVDEQRVVDFVRSLFKLNGLLDTPNRDSLDVEFLRFRSGNYHEKVSRVTKYLVAQAQKPTLILSATFQLDSKFCFDQGRDISRSSSKGYEDIGKLGYERYEISTIPTLPGLQEADIIISATRTHYGGSTSGRWPKTDFIGGSLYLQEHFAPDSQTRSLEDESRTNAQNLEELVQLF